MRLIKIAILIWVCLISNVQAKEVRTVTGVAMSASVGGFILEPKNKGMLTWVFKLDRALMSDPMEQKCYFFGSVNPEHMVAIIQGEAPKLKVLEEYRYMVVKLSGVEAGAHPGYCVFSTVEVIENESIDTIEVVQNAGISRLRANSPISESIVLVQRMEAQQVEANDTSDIKHVCRTFNKHHIKRSQLQDKELFAQISKIYSERQASLSHLKGKKIKLIGIHRKLITSDPEESRVFGCFYKSFELVD